MAIARQTDATKIKPGRNAIIEQMECGAAVAAGEIVSIQSDGFCDPAIATGVVLNGGIAVKAGGVGDVIDVVVLGKVRCLTGATPGAAVYVSDTAGEPAEAAGTKSFVIGYAMSAQDLMVVPQTVAFA